MSRPGALRSRVAVFLVLALLASSTPQVFASPSSQPAPEPMRVAIGDCSDGTNGTVPGLTDTLERALRKSLQDQRGLQVVNVTTGVADRVVSVRIARVNAPANGDAAEVQVIAESADPSGRDRAYLTTVQAESVGRPGEDRVARVHRAVEVAASQVAAQVAQAEGLRALVIATPTGDTATIDRGSEDGIVVGTELDIIRDGKVIARLRVERVRDSTATGRVSDETGPRVMVGDQARVKSSPAGASPKPAKKKSRNDAAIIAGVVILGVLIAALANGGGGGGGGVDVQLAAADTLLPADGVSSTTITATVKNRRGQPLPDGTMVKFRTTRGLIAPAQVPLTSGQAQATLVADTAPGRATITATAKGANATVNVEFTQAGNTVVPTSLFVYTNAEQVPADGQSTATVTAVVGDANNNPVPDGTPVNFTTTLGLIGPGSVATQNGVAEATLRASLQAGTAQVTVRAGQLTQQVDVEFVTSGAQGRRTLFLTRSAARIPADGVSTATIQATVRNASNNAVADGTQVAFSSTAGTIFPAQAGTINGIATATLRSDRAPDRARVTAVVGNLTATIDVVFVGTGTSTIASIFLTREPPEIPGDGTSTSTITAVVRDPQNNPVPDGTPVIFTSTRGLIVPGIGYTENGTVAATLQSEPTSTDVTATVTAVAGPQKAVTTVRFTAAGGGGTTQINLIADTTNIPADGTSTTQLIVTLVDGTGTPVPGATVNLVTTAGRLRVVGTTTWAAQVSGTTNQQGVMEALLRSTTTPNTATVTASAPAVTAATSSVTVSFTTLVITSVTADPASVPVGGNKSSTVTAVIVDSSGKPAPDGTVVRFSILNAALVASGASITGSASTAGGKATAIFRSGTAVGTAQIRVEVPSANAVNDQTIIGITAGPPLFITVAVSAFVTSSQAISKEATVDVTALVADEFNNPVEDGTAVRFDVTPAQGAVITGTDTTTGGFAQAKLYPTGYIGDVTILVSTTGANGAPISNAASPTTIHMGGPPVALTIVGPPAANYSPASPLQLYTEADQAIVVEAIDSTGGPADPFSQISFTVTRGDVKPDPASITAPLSGYATAVYRSDQPTPVGDVDEIVAHYGTTVHSQPLYIFVEVNPAK